MDAICVSTTYRYWATSVCGMHTGIWGEYYKGGRSKAWAWRGHGPS